MINTQLLVDIANSIEQRAAKVVLNGNYEITSFDVKQVDGSTVVLNYFVLAADVSLITLVELKDSANEILSSNPVNVPLASDTMILQTILVKEAP